MQKLIVEMMRYFIVAVMMLCLVSVEAQGFGGQSGTNFSGRGRRLVPSTPGVAASYNEKPDANILSIERANMYEELLGLDVFTKEVLKSYLKDHYTKLIQIQFDEESPLEERKKSVETQKKEFKSLLDDFLPEEQVERLIIEEETGNAEKKVKKQKKERKKKRKNKGDK